MPDATPANTRDYDMHADAHRPMIEPDETIGDYGARCYAAGRDDAQFAAQDAADLAGTLEGRVGYLEDANRTLLAERDAARAELGSAHRMASGDLDKVARLLRDIASIAQRDADVHRTAAKGS